MLDLNVLLMQFAEGKTLAGTLMASPLPAQQSADL
jgi:hypothetical protein